MRLHEQHAAIGKHPDGRRSNVDAVDTEIRLRKIAGNERKDVWSFALSRKKGGPDTQTTKPMARAISRTPVVKNWVTLP